MHSSIETRCLWVVYFEGFDSTWIDFGDSDDDAIASAGGIGWDKAISDVRFEPVIASRAIGLEHPRHRAIPNETTDEIMLRVYPFTTGCGKNIAESWIWHRWSEYADHPSLLCADCIPAASATPGT